MAKGKKIEWSEEMLQVLKENYATEINGDLAARLGVGVRALRYKAQAMGLKKASDFRSWPEVRRRIRIGLTCCDRTYYFREHPEVGEKTRFRKGNSFSPEKERARQQKATAARRRQTYDEKLRLKYGLRQETRLKLKTEYYVDRAKYFPEEYR